MKRFLLALLLSACTASNGGETSYVTPDAASDAPDICRECYCYTAPECTAELNLACGCPKECAIGPLETCRLTMASDGVSYFCC